MNNSLIIGTVVLLAIVFLIGSHCTLKEGATGTPTNNPCPPHFPYASEYPKKGSGEWYCYTEKDGGGGVCSYGGTSPTPDGKGEWNSNQPPCPASKSAAPSAPSSSSTFVPVPLSKFFGGSNETLTSCSDFQTPAKVGPYKGGTDSSHMSLSCQAGYSGKDCSQAGYNSFAKSACQAGAAGRPKTTTSSVGATSGSSGTAPECKTITKENVKGCAAKANANNRLAAVKQLELDECIKLGASWKSAVTGHYQDPACCNPKTSTCCCLGDNCTGIDKCAFPGSKAKPDLPAPITGKKLAQICQGAPFPPKKGMTLAQRQAALLKTNENLMTLSNKIYACIEKIYASRVKLGTYSAAQRQNMSNQLEQYEKIRKKLLQEQKEQSSLQAMLTDKELQTSSTSMHYMVWLILAISGGVIALTQLSR